MKFMQCARVCLVVIFMVFSHYSLANNSTAASEWIIEHLDGVPITTGDLTGRKNIEMPALVINANNTRAGKNAFEPRSGPLPNDNQVGFVNVNISGLYRDNSPTGAGIATDRNGNNVGTILYLSNVNIAPGWPDFISYDDTNFDGIVLDGAAAIYGQDVTISDVNNDSAIDNKAEISQFVRLNVSGKAHRSLRYWASGPHYLVDSNISNSGGAGSGVLIWMRNCAETELRIYNSTFNGSSKIPEDKIRCDNNTGPPNIIYLDSNPRSDMHPMFKSNAGTINPVLNILLDETV